MLTIGDFIERTAAEQPVNFIHRFFVLWESYNSLLQENAQPLLTAEQFLPLAETILSDFDQLDFELVDPGMLYKELRDIAAINLQFETLSAEQKAYLAGFWEGFQANKNNSLQEKFLELWSLLPQLYSAYKSGMKQRSWTDTATCYRELAEGKTQAEVLFQQFDHFIFVGFNALSKCEQVLFQQWQQAGKASFYFDADQYYLEDPLQEAGLFLRKNLKETGLRQALEPIPTLLNRPGRQLKVYPMEGKIAQAKALSLLLQKTADATASGTPSRAIILADESLLVPVIESIPDSYKLNITMGFPFKNSPLFSLVELWLQVREQLLLSPASVPVALLDAYFAHPFITSEKPGEWLQLDPGSTIPLQALPDTFRDIQFFEAFKDGSATLSGLRAILDELFETRKNSGHLSPIDGALILQLLEVIAILEGQLLQFPEMNKPTVLLPFLRKHCTRLSAPIEGAPLEGLQIMGMLESRCLDFDEVYILGANEGTLPGLSLSPTLIPDSIRRAFGLPILQNQDALSAYLFYRLLQRSSTTHVFYDALVSQSSSGEKSRFLAQLAFECPELDMRQFSQHQPALLPQQAREPLHITKSGEVTKQLDTFLGDGNGQLSASALKRYLQCPLQFYLKYIADIREPDTGKTALAPAEIGNAVHAVMYRFYEPLRGAQITAEVILDRMQTLPALCSEAVLQRAGRAFPKSEPASTDLIAIRIVETYARLFLEHDSKLPPFEILGLEEKIRQQVAIHTGGNLRKVNLYAIIDRIDRVNGETRIVDYKTGSDSLLLADVESLFDPENKNENPAAFQTLLYAHIYEAAYSRRAMPNLYSYQWLKKCGSLPGTGKPEKFEPHPPERLHEFMDTFKPRLIQLLEELFDPAIPFTHNPHARYCEKSPYAAFCGF